MNRAQFLPVLDALKLGLAAWLLVAIPFRATVGWRGGILTFLAVFTLSSLVLRREWRQFLPKQRVLVFAALAWLLVTGVSALFGTDPSAALGPFRRDVIAAVLGFVIFYALRAGQQRLWLLVVVVMTAQLVLTVMVVRDPFQAVNPHHRPAYIDVGVLSTWLILVTPLLGVLWCAPRAWRMPSRVFAVGCLVALVVAAQYSGSRVVWMCFGAMALCVPLATGGPRQTRMGVWLVVGLIVSVFALLARVSIEQRAHDLTLSRGPGAPAVEILQDPRPVLWRTAAEMIAEHPWVGRGYASPTLPPEFQRRLLAADPTLHYEHAHNTLLTYALQIGVPGVLVVLALFASLTLAFAQRLREPGLGRVLGACGLAMVGGFFLRNQLDDFFFRQSLLLFACLAGLLLGALTKISND